jgi:thiol-disulfide isomerase/thioredoxin
MTYLILHSAKAPLIAAIWLLAAIALATARGQDASTELLPSDPSMWLNSPPLTTTALKGKGVVLWFFEETCPTCRGKWPRMYELAKKYEGQPVVFIAVNSGTSPAEVQQYAREVKLSWPIIVDPTRQFEKLWLDQEISLQNIHQCELILPTGQKDLGRWDDLDGSVKQALEGAAWKIDPKTIPAAFMPTWQAVELGNYQAAASLLKKGMATKNVEVKEAATRVNTFVQEQIRSAIEAAGKAREAGDAWKAYQLYTGVSRTFAGYELPAEVAAAQKELASDAKVKQQLEAAKLLDGVKKTLAAARTDAARKRVVTRLEQLASQHPGTDAAQEARRQLDQLQQQP